MCLIPGHELDTVTQRYRVRDRHPHNVQNPPRALARSVECATVRPCFVGDSFINGTGDDTCLGWVGRVCAAMRASGRDLTLYNLGIRRDTSADIAVRWLDETSRRLPQGVDGLKTV